MWKKANFGSKDRNEWLRFVYDRGFDQAKKAVKNTLQIKYAMQEAFAHFTTKRLVMLRTKLGKD